MLCVLGVGITAVAAVTDTNLIAISSATSSPVLHNITIRGALTDSMTGLGIPNATVILNRSTDNGGTWSDYSSASTNQGGQYIFDFNETNATTATATYKYNVRFDGTTQYNPSRSSDIAVTWTMTPTTLSATVSPARPSVGQNFTISGRLTTDGSPLNATSIALYRWNPATTVWEVNQSTTTNTSGDYLFSINESVLGNYLYASVFAGDNTYGWSFAYVTAAIKTPTAITASASTSTTTVGQNFTISGRLTTEGTGLSNQTVTLLTSTDNATWTSATSTTTNATGNYNFTVSESSAGTHYYRASYAGTSTYASAVSDVVTVAIIPESIALTASASTSTTTVGQNFTISGRLTTEGTGLSNQTVTLLTSTDNATWTSATSTTTNATGNYNFTVSESSAGTHYYRASYAGTSTYASAVSDVVTVAIIPEPAPLISITIVQLVPVAPQYLEWDITNMGTTDAWVAPSAKLYLQTATPPGYAPDGTITGYYVNNATTFTTRHGDLGWVHILPGQTYRIYSQAVVPSNAKWALYNANTFYNGNFHGLLYPSWNQYVTLR